MGKFNSKVEQLESRTVSLNRLCSKFEVPLHIKSYKISQLIIIYMETLSLSLKMPYDHIFELAKTRLWNSIYENERNEHCHVRV
jgi:hypothetical protein